MFIHYLATRFNIKVSRFGPENMDSPVMDAAWLEKRLSLFLQYCAPSVLVQSQPNFIWLIYLDPETPKEIMRRIDFLLHDTIKVEFCFVEDYPAMLSDLQNKIRRSESPYVITTRMDNDDVISKHFIHHIQTAFLQKHRMVINFLSGYEYSRADKVLKKWNVRFHNQFISLIEKSGADDILSVYGFPHWKLPVGSEIINLKVGPQWLYIRHELNYSGGGITGIPQLIRPSDLKLFPESIQKMPVSLTGTLKYARLWIPKMIKRKFLK
jgi:hypothetical protein